MQSRHLERGLRFGPVVETRRAGRGAEGAAQFVLFGEAEEEHVQVGALLLAQGRKELVLDLACHRA